MSLLSRLAVEHSVEVHDMTKGRSGKGELIIESHDNAKGEFTVEDCLTTAVEPC